MTGREPEQQGWKAFWSPVELQPSPFLASTYDLVLEHSQKRMPKWKFKLAGDLVMEIQPKPTRTGRRFVFAAIQAEGATADLLKTTKGAVHPWIRLSGSIADPGEGNWRLKFVGIGWHRDMISNSADPELRFRFRERIAAIFLSGRFNQLDPRILLHSHCICCGKPLSDPASMSRYIGSECWQNISAQTRAKLKFDVSNSDQVIYAGRVVATVPQPKEDDDNEAGKGWLYEQH
jgi:hypothetical protein